MSTVRPNHPPRVLSSASKQHPFRVHPARWPGSIQHGVGATIPLLHHHLSTLLFSSSIQSRCSDGEARASVWKVGEGSRRARACLIWCNVGCYGGHQPARQQWSPRCAVTVTATFPFLFPHPAPPVPVCGRVTPQAGHQRPAERPGQQHQPDHTGHQRQCHGGHRCQDVGQGSTDQYEAQVAARPWRPPVVCFAC